MKIIKISTKVPSIVWVDSDNKIAYVKGGKGRPDRLTYNQFREAAGAGEKVQITMPSGAKFKGPFRQLEVNEVLARLDEIFSKYAAPSELTPYKYIIGDESIEKMSTDDLKHQLSWLYNDNQIIEQEEAGIDWGYDLNELQRTRKAIEEELKKREKTQNF